MKKYLVVVIFFCLVLCSFVLLSYAQQAEQVEVTHCSGKIEVLLAGADEYTDAEDNMVLSAGDKIKTASGASVELSFNEANTNLVRLDENTSVNVSLSGDEKIEMTEGEVFSSISELPSGSAFEIRTPTAVSGARGTDWVTKVTEEGTDVEALESVPYVRNFESGGNLSKEITRIVPGQMTTVRKFQKPMALRPMADTRRQKWQQVKREVVQRGFEAMRKRQDMPPFNRKDFINKIKEKGNLKRQNLNPIREIPSGDERGFRQGGREPLTSGTGGSTQMRNELGDKSGVLVSDGRKPENDFRAPGQELRDQRGSSLGEKTRRMEQMGQQDFNQKKNEMRGSSGVLGSDVKEHVNENREQRDNLLKENREKVEEKNQLRGDKTQRTQGMGRMGQDAQKPQPKRSSPQRIMKPGPVRR